MNGFDEVRFPDKIDYGFEGGPVYNTVVIETDGGSEQRISKWANGRHEYTCSSGIKNSIDRDLIVAFFHARQGRARGFRWKDWNDYRVSVPTLMLPITSTTFQFVKRYSSASQEVVRKIRKPVAGSAILYSSATGTLIASGWTYDNTTGIITFSSAPSTAVYAIFDFDVPVRFDVDKLSFNRSGFAINEWSSIKIIEIKDYEL